MNNTIFSDYPDVLTVKQLAKALNIGLNKAYELVNTGAIRTLRVGTKIIIPKNYLFDYITAGDYNELA